MVHDSFDSHSNLLQAWLKGHDGPTQAGSQTVVVMAAVSEKRGKIRDTVIDDSPLSFL
jgi:hypothetical protein